MASSYGLMVAAIRAIGKVASSTARVFMSLAKVTRSTVSGKTASVSDGSEEKTVALEVLSDAACYVLLVYCSSDTHIPK
jgi:hypothetical protein